MPRTIASIPEGGMPAEGLRTRAPADYKSKQPPSPISPYDQPSSGPTSPTPLYSTSKGGNNLFFPEKRSPNSRSSPSLLLPSQHAQVLHTSDRQHRANPSPSRPMTADVQARTQSTPPRPARRSVPSGATASALPRVNMESRPAFPDLLEGSPLAGDGKAAPADGPWPVVPRPGSSHVPSRPGSSQVSSRDKGACRHVAAQAMVAERDKDSLAMEWNQMMCGLDGLDVSGDTDAYTLACAILLVKEGIFNYQENAPATACHCCNRAHQRDPLINMMLLDGLMGGAMTRLRQRGKTPTVPADIDFHTINDTDRLILMTNIYGVSGKGTQQRQRYPRPRPPPSIQSEQVGVQTDPVDCLHSIMQTDPIQCQQSTVQTDALECGQSSVQTDAVGCEDLGVQADPIPKPEVQDSSCQTEEEEQVAPAAAAEAAAEMVAEKKRSAGELLLDSFDGADLQRLEAFAGTASQSLSALLELAASMRAGLDATAAQPAALALASATMSAEAAVVEGAAGDATAQLAGVAAVLGSCLEQTRSQLEGGRLAGNDSAADGGARESVDAPQGLVDALASLAAVQDQLNHLGGDGNAAASAEALELLAMESDTSMAESGLPSLVPLLQQLQLAGTQLVRSFATALSACLGAAGLEADGGDSRAAGFAAALGDAGAAAGAVQRLLRLLADKTQMARSILTHRPRKSSQSPALELMSDLGAVAEARYSALMEWVSPALQAMQALSASWAVDNRTPEQCEAAMAMVQQLLGNLNAWSQDLSQGLGATMEVQERGAKPLGLQDALHGSTGDTAAAMAANLSSLADAVKQLYATAETAAAVTAAAETAAAETAAGETAAGETAADETAAAETAAAETAAGETAADETAADATAADETAAAADPEAEASLLPKVVHASALVPLVQGHLLTAGLLLDSWISSTHKAWDVIRAHALHEALQDKGLASYPDLLQENVQLLEKLKALEEKLESVIKEGEEALQAALAKAEAAEAALADLFGPGKGMNPEEAEAARRQISELQEELAAKAAALEAAQKSLEEMRASLEAAMKTLEEMEAKSAALAAAEAKLQEMEAKLQEAEKRMKAAEEKLGDGEGRLQESKKRLEASERDLADARGKLQGRDAEHQKEMEALKQRIQELEDALKKALAKPEPPTVEKGMCGC